MHRVRARRSALYAGAAALAVLCTGAAEGDAAPVAWVGTEALGRELLSRHARELAGFQRAQLGAHWPEQRARLLQEQLVREALLRQAAKRAGFEGSAAFRAGRDRILEGELLAGLRSELEVRVTEQDIRQYYAAHEGSYRKPRSLSLWRLLAKDEPSARALLGRAQALSASAWSQLVREESVDLATRMRNGSLGYVFPDGQTERPQVRVSAALFEAADRVRDGKLVPTPVPEGEHFAVVWRRGSRPAQQASLESVRESIRSILLEQRIDSERRRLLAELRQRQLSEYHPEVLEGFSPGEPPATRRPERLSGAERSADPLPRPSDRGLR